MNSAPTDKRQIFVVDDEPGNTIVLSNLLAGNYALSVATSGAQALQS
jgi:CheY-like chemotaxis protein